MKKNLMRLVFLSVLTLSGCSSAPYTPGPDMDQLYSNINREAQKDAIHALRKGLRTQPGMGTTDPYYPMRKPETIVPVWVTKKIHPMTGRRIDPHWEYIVIDEADWAY